MCFTTCTVELHLLITTVSTLIFLSWSIKGGVLALSSWLLNLTQSRLFRTLKIVEVCMMSLALTKFFLKSRTCLLGLGWRLVQICRRFVFCVCVCVCFVFWLSSSRETESALIFLCADSCTDFRADFCLCSFLCADVSAQIFGVQCADFCADFSSTFWRFKSTCSKVPQKCA